MSYPQQSWGAPQGGPPQSPQPPQPRKLTNTPGMIALTVLGVVFWASVICVSVRGSGAGNDAGISATRGDAGENAPEVERVVDAAVNTDRARAAELARQAHAERVMRAHGRTGAVGVMGENVILGAPCSEIAMMIASRWLAEDLEAAVVLAPETRFVACYDPDSNDRAQARFPPIGAVLPESVEWHRRLVVTPTSLPRRGRAPVFCFEFRDERPFVRCFRSIDGCVANRREAVGEDEAVSTTSCAPTETLWCFDVDGVETHCALSRAGCRAFTERYRRHGADCENRWAL